MLNTVTSLIRIKNVAATALIVAALCAVAFSAISVQPQNDARAQTPAKGLILSTTSISTEEGVSTNPTFTIKLAAAPSSGNVGFLVTPTSGATVSVDSSTLTWTSGTGSSTSTVTVTPDNDDDGADETVTLTISVLGANVDPDYAALENQTVTVNIADDDQGITAQLKGDSTNTDCTSPGNVIDTSNLFIVTEDTDGDFYCVKLAAAPAAVAAGETAETVTVTITSDNRDVSPDVDPARRGFQNTLTFTGDVAAGPSDNPPAVTGTWDTLVPVHVIAEGDTDLTMNDETATLSHAATGGGYSLGADETSAQLTVNVRDDDRAIFIDAQVPAVEGESTAVFEVSLGAAPTVGSGTVITATEVDADGNEVTSTHTQLSAGPTVSGGVQIDSFDDVMTISLTPVVDDNDTQDSTVYIKITATGGGYGEGAAAMSKIVPVTIVDDDRGAGVTIGGTKVDADGKHLLSVDEGDSTTYTVVLDAPPTGAESTVTITVAIKDNAGGIFVDTDTSTTAQDHTLTFTKGSPGLVEGRWFMPQAITVTGAADSDMEDDVVTLTHSVTNSADDNVYDGFVDGTMSVPDVEVTAKDSTTKAPTPAGASGQVDIRSVSPSVKGVTVSAGDTVRLMVNVYALDKNLLQKLADRVGFDWAVNGVAIPDTGGKGNDEISYTAPSSPGTYTVKATLMGNECLYTGTGDDYGKNCEAEFEIKVRRSAPAAEPTAVPVNPLGEIPDIISGNDGKQYEVFTPEEGGTFDGDSHSITAGSGIVPSGEYIGVRMDGAGSASNAGMTAHRYTLVGDAYTVSVADSAGEAINSYALNGAAKVCLPLPAAARSNISDVALAVKLSDGSLQILSGTVRIAGASGPDVCGHVSSIPATVAVGTAGAPAAFTPTPEPTATPEPPETGGTAPSNGAPLALLLLLGIATAALGTFLLAGRRATR